MSTEKKYGLILSNKAARNKTVLNSTSVFGDDDDEDSVTAVNTSLKKDSTKTLLKRQVQLEIEKAIADDPTVYEYDSIFDNLQATKASNDKRISSSADRKPKYIGNLIKAAEDRKKELERRMERKIHKERETEKGKFDDKEAFVTDAYRQKMELLKQEEEKERINDEIEAMNDVTKQSDLSGFYRNLLKQTVGETSSSTQVQPDVVDRKLSLAEKLTADDRDDSSESDSGSSSDEEDGASNNARDQVHVHRSRDDREQQDSRSRADRHSTNDKDNVDNKNKDKRGKCSSYDRKEPATERPCKSSSNRHDRVDEDSRPVLEVKMKNERDSSKRRSDDSRLDDKRVKTDNDIKSNTKQVNIVKRTTDSSLEDARARYLARKAAMKVPVHKEDSD